ncbi:hypothetical protein BDZ45DRAFT_772307 [Acephala macrosclerotiorum]|nr:hypothetical protein BDZ45DRAFT_772307 [Acephala macrosclerotiorum]
MMGDIYSRAEEVLMWLGEADEQSRTALSLFRKWHAFLMATIQRIPTIGQRQLDNDISSFVEDNIAGNVTHQRDFYNFLTIVIQGILTVGGRQQLDYDTVKFVAKSLFKDNHAGNVTQQESYNALMTVVQGILAMGGGQQLDNDTLSSMAKTLLKEDLSQNTNAQGRSYNSNLDGLVSFFKRPYWKRIWILQEVIRPRCGTILCGRDRLGLLELWLGLLALCIVLEHGKDLPLLGISAINAIP